MALPPRLPELSEPAVRILRSILETKVVRGADLMRRTGLRTPEQLLPAVKELLAGGLIEVSGNPYEEGTVPFATFGIRPSDISYLQMVVQQGPKA